MLVACLRIYGQVAFGEKPNLGNVYEWGEKVYVQLDKKGLKFGGRVQEGRWLGIDEKSKGVQIYWLDTKSITIERNVYFNDTSVSHNGGEQDNVVITKTNLPSTSETPVISTLADDNNNKVENPTPHVHKPSQHVQELLQGNSIWSNR